MVKYSYAGSNEYKALSRSLRLKNFAYLAPIVERLYPWNYIYDTAKCQKVKLFRCVVARQAVHGRGLPLWCLITNGSASMSASTEYCGAFYAPVPVLLRAPIVVNHDQGCTPARR